MRQYIGARYVPRFSEVNGGVWSDVYSYEPLIIVKNGNDYYTSKQSVPVGIAITNTDYWVKTGDYNGAISGLQNQIDVIKTRITRPRAERKFVILGDSYAGGYTPDSAERKGWFHYFITQNGLTLGTNVFKSSATGVGNSKFSLEDTELSFVNHLRSVVENVLPSYNVSPLDITDIIVLGGTNDIAYNSSQISAGMAAFFSYQKEHFPNAFVKVGVLSGSTDKTYTHQNGFINVIANYQNCGKYGAAYITNSEFICANRELFSSDGIHPSVSGYEAISKYTSSIIDAYSVDVLYSEYTTTLFTFDSGISSGGRNANIRLHNNLITLNFATTPNPYLPFSFATPITISTPIKVGTFKIGTINSKLIKGVGAGNALSFTTPVSLNANGSAFPTGFGSLAFEDGDVYVYHAIPITDTSKSYTQFMIGVEYEMPTIYQGF